MDWDRIERNVIAGQAGAGKRPLSLGRTLWKIAAVIVVSISCLMFYRLLIRPGPRFYTVETDLHSAALPRVVKMEGAIRDFSFKSGISVRTSGDQQLILQFAESTGVLLSSNSKLAFKQSAATDLYCFLESGSATFQFSRNHGFTGMAVETPGALYKITGTKFKVVAQPDAQSQASKLVVYKGSVAQLNKKGGGVDFVNGGCYSLVNGKETRLQKFIKQESGDFSDSFIYLLTQNNDSHFAFGRLKYSVSDSITVMLNGEYLGRGVGMIDLKPGKYGISFISPAGSALFDQSFFLADGKELLFNQKYSQKGPNERMIGVETVQDTAPVEVIKDFEKISQSYSALQGSRTELEKGPPFPSALKKPPDEIDEFEQVNAALSGKDYQGAAATLEKLLASTAASDVREKATYLLGTIYKENLKDFEKAQAYFEKYLDAFPHGLLIEEASFSLAEVCLINDRADKAASHLTSFTNDFPHHPKLPEALYLLGNIHRQYSQDYEKAAICYGNIVKNFRTSVFYENSLYWQSKCLLLSGKENKAVEISRQYLQDFPKGRWVKQIKEDIRGK